MSEWTADSGVTADSDVTVDGRTAPGSDPIVLFPYGRSLSLLGFGRWLGMVRGESVREALYTFEREQLAGSNRPYTVDVGVIAVAPWERHLFVAANAFVRPSDWHETGFVYQNSGTAGQSGPLEPAWPTTSGATVTDGSLTWTAVVPPGDGEDTISSVSWTQQDPPDDELTITDETGDSLTATAFFGGGTSGNVYVILIAVTMMSGAIYPAQLILTIL